MQPMSTYSVALFPIPNLVAFPGTVVPLHVFEPRYRTMINDCVEQERMIGVCHTRKEISAPKKDQTVQQALKSNQATYEPYSIFSAGLCEIVETTDDYRIYANIDMSVRLRLLEETQTLPYRIVSCEEVHDSNENPEETRLFQASIATTVRDMIASRNPKILEMVDRANWQDMDPTDFSFRIFQILQFHADIMQDLLEDTDVLSRLRQIDTILTEATRNG